MIRYRMLLTAAAIVPAAVHAQTPATPDQRNAWVVGAQARQLRFRTATDQFTVRQVVVPAGLSWRRGAFGLDLGSAWVDSRLEAGAVSRSVSGLTDTQVRGTYTLGRDLAVLTVAANLPTGLKEAPLADGSVLGAVSSSFLAFPVPAHGSGAALTGGLAVAVPAGDWNIGLAGSLRWSAEYTPYREGQTAFAYQAGMEGRLRAGVDRVVGRSRVTAGLTYSTFGTDEFAAGSTVTGAYQPGPRWIAEAATVTAVGARSSLSVFGWHYQRTDGDANGVSVGNRERISGLGAALRSTLAPAVEAHLGLDGRLARIGETPGRLVGGEAGLGLRLSGRVSLVPTIRYETGRLEPGSGNQTLRGISGSVFLRSSF